MSNDTPRPDYPQWMLDIENTARDPGKFVQRGPFFQLLEYAKESFSELAAMRAKLAEAEAHEQETHRSLGAILGTDDSLEQCALRMKQRAEAAEKDVAEALAHIRLILPLAKGYAAINRVGVNAELCSALELFLAAQEAK